MNLLTVQLALAACAVAAGAALRTQEAGGPCAGLYPAPKVGEYAEMELRDPAEGSVRIRLAIVGEEELDGTTYYWIEVMRPAPAIEGLVIAQMLVPHYPFDQKDIKGYILKQPGQPAARVPQELIETMGSTAAGQGWKERCEALEQVGVEEVTVPAGTFTAQHFHGAGEGAGDVWLAQVPFGMVKMIQADALTELLAYGSDAKSSLTEKPVELQMPPPPDRPR